MDNEDVGVKFSEFPSETPENTDEVVGLHAGDNARFSVANFILAIRQGLANIFVPLTRTINEKPLDNDIALVASDVGAVDADDVGKADGVASLDSTGKVPSSQMPPIPSDASDITYDPTTSGLTAANVQAAIDEVVDDLGDKQSTITASGILKGDGQGGVSAATAGTDYQAPITIDATPTANSTNPVQSGGVYTDVRTRVPVYGKGVNLLRNWYFVGGGTGRGVFPVNSRGQNLYSASGYTIDGWAFSANGYTQTLTSAGLQITGSRNQYYLLNQKISDASAGKTVTFAIWSNYGMTTRTLTMSDGYGYAIGDHFSIDISINSGSHYIYIGFKSTEATGTSLNITFYAVGAFLGTEQTLCHNEGTAEAPVWVLNDVPDYEYELYRCMTSTADPSDTYANKSLITEPNPSYGPYTASGGTMDVEYYYKIVGELVYITGAATPTATVGVTGRSDVTFSDLPKDIAAIPVFMSANNCTVSSSDLRPVLQMAYLGGKGFRFQGQATLNRAFQFSIIYS